MISFFKSSENSIYAVQYNRTLEEEEILKLSWLFGNATIDPNKEIHMRCVGPRATMVTPWSTNAVEITQNMGIVGLERIECFEPHSETSKYDPMLQQVYEILDQSVFTSKFEVSPILAVENIGKYNTEEGLALSDEEVEYLEQLSTKIGRSLTDSEVFGFSQVNSEHCRHKIFNGTFIIDDVVKEKSLFQMIKDTSLANNSNIISAYKDNVAFVNGPQVIQFAPKRPDQPSIYCRTPYYSVLSLKAETHNFPTTVEPFNGAATGSGGEIRDRMAGGQGSIPLAGTAVYMTSYSRINPDKPWEKTIPERPWIYQSPIDILIKASNGASDFGNKFGQPLIVGSLYTFEHIENNRFYAYDKVIMLAGGVGYAKKEHAQKLPPQPDQDLVILGGENYRIGMGGAAVSSADTGAFGNMITLNAIQRSNPEMQKRVANTIRGLVEYDNNPIVSIHDHGAGGHLNCLSELVEDTGGKIFLDALPVGDPSLSAKELLGNESQERMGLVLGAEDFEFLEKIALRERAPIYKVGKIMDDQKFIVIDSKGNKPIDLMLSDFFGSSPKTIIKDHTLKSNYQSIAPSTESIYHDLMNVLSLESVACKDWLTNKVDRCVSGRVAVQQCIGPLQLPLNNCGVISLDYESYQGVATSIGHAPASALINPASGSRNSIAEALTNLVWAPIKNGLTGVSLSANWMWPCKNEGESARLYEAVQACSNMAIALGINIPTGKDSLSMTQKYADKEVLSPGTVIISTIGHCTDIRKVIEPLFKPNEGDIFYINMSFDSFELGGSVFAQTKNKLGGISPDIKDFDKFKTAFNAIQKCINNNWIVAGHDIGSGGLITSLLELCFSDREVGANIDLSSLDNKDTSTLLFAENVGLIFQSKKGHEKEISALFENILIPLHKLGMPSSSPTLIIQNGDDKLSFEIEKWRNIWFETSYQLDRLQAGEKLALERKSNLGKQPLSYVFPSNFNGALPDVALTKKPKAAIIREKGSNSEREMANAMDLAGFEVIDIHMTDLVGGKASLDEIQFIGAVGGFSNSDVLGSAKGWAGAFKYNKLANEELIRFFTRKDTLSVGICNGCQLFMELDLIFPEMEHHPKMHHNLSKKHESCFTSVIIQKNNSVMLSSLEGTTLGVWVSHGEGRFSLESNEEKYNIVAKYGYDAYPANPNGSDHNAAMLVSNDGRHLVMMPHIERSLFPWNWPYYPTDKSLHQVSPWFEAFKNAFNWCSKHQK